jgi:lipopolysaccharide transport system permease protein
MLKAIREILTYRHLVSSLVARDLRVRYKRSALGVVWAFAEPLALMALFTVVFSHVLRLDVPNYPLFVLAGVLVWGFFSTGVTHALGAVQSNASLVKKVYFPRAILPLSTVFGRLVHLVLSLLLLAPFLAYFGVRPGLGLLLLPVLVLLQALLVAGLALFFSALSTLYEDVSFLVSFAFTGLFYVSPVLYPLELVPERYRLLYALNPMSTLLTGYRAALLGLPWPRPGEIAIAVAITLVAFLAGTLVFRRLEWIFPEVL